MPVIRNISYRRVLNSHVEFTSEFIVRLEDGSIGSGAPPSGETISIYEDHKADIEPQKIIRAIENDGCLGTMLDQESFDRYLEQQILYFGRNNAYGLSEAFYDATRKTKSYFDLFGKTNMKLSAPRICFNTLNGGRHAYTNPVLSDFTEFILVAKSADTPEVISEHNEIQRRVKEKLLKQPKTVVSGNPVNCFPTRDNREVIEFLLSLVDGLGLSRKYELMIDASAGDLWTGEGYCLGVTDGRTRSGGEFIEYWMDLIRQYGLRFLEDPFHEKDYASWQQITCAQQSCHIIGDNLYSSDEKRILEGAEKKYTTGAIIKPNQAGTVSGVRRSLEAALNARQTAITSHRSISTESTFLSLLTCLYAVPFIKIGPLMTDYSSVIRLNEIIRLTDDRDED